MPSARKQSKGTEKKASNTPPSALDKKQADEIINTVERLFQNYLRKKGHRCTPERMLVLREIYVSPEHLDADQIFLNLKQKGHDVSRATVYNTLDLLVECNLVEQNSFGHKHLHYERSYGYRPHHHIVCEKCGHVFEFQSPEIDEELRKLCEGNGFKLKRNSLQLFGECVHENCDLKPTEEEKIKNIRKHPASQR